jgi:hypothetical protein
VIDLARVGTGAGLDFELIADIREADAKSATTPSMSKPTRSVICQNSRRSSEIRWNGGSCCPGGRNNPRETARDGETDSGS